MGSLDVSVDVIAMAKVGVETIAAERATAQKAALDAAFEAWWSEAFSHKMNVAFASEGGRKEFLEALHTMAKAAWLSGVVTVLEEREVGR